MMKRQYTSRAMLLLAAATAAMAAMAQTLDVNVGDVTYRYAASQCGDMTYSGGSALTIGARTYTLADVGSVTVDGTGSVKDNTVDVAYSASGAKVVVAGNVAPYVDATVSGGHVTLLQAADYSGDEITYTLSGTSSNGSLYMDGKLKASFVLNGLTLTNPDSAAINIRDGKRISVEIASGTTNSLADGSGGSQKACFMVKGHTEFKGGGTLNLAGYTGHAFWGKEYVELKKSVGAINITKAVADGMNVNQYYEQKGGTVTISGVGDDGIAVAATDDNTDEQNGQVIFTAGTLNISVTAAAAKGLKCDSLMTITDGTLTITTSGGVSYDSTDKDYKGSSCLKSDTAITINGGTLTLTSSGQGGKAISSDGTLAINGGTVTAKATGSNYGSSSSGGGFNPGRPGQGGFGGSTSSAHKYAKGVKSDGDMTITGGTLTVTSSSHEGLEAKGTMTITGGTVNVTASDDAINSGGDMIITGGNVYAYSSGNDGLDANGNMYLKGGVIMAFASTSNNAESGIDIDERHKLYITGGEIFSVGGRNDFTVGTATGSQAYTSLSSITLTSGGYAVVSRGGTALFAVKVPASYSRKTGIASSSRGSGTFSVASSTSVSGTAVNGYIAY